MHVEEVTNYINVLKDELEKAEYIIIDSRAALEFLENELNKKSRSCNCDQE